MLLRADIAEQIARLYKTSPAPSSADLLKFREARAARPHSATKLAGARPAAGSDPENYAVVGSTAQITVEGVLSEEPDFWAWLFGMDGTTYKDVRDALALAAADPQVRNVVLAVSSPGGYVDGLFETLAALEAFAKPMSVRASQAQSAAFGMAAIAGPITADGPASAFGSVGVAIDFRFSSDIEYVSVTSTHAPDKRPDPRTAEGKAVVVAELDALHELFVDAIARGRSRATGKSFTVETVNTDFGRGATYLAEAAKAAGMIDKMPRTAKSGASASADEQPPTAAERGSEKATSMSTPTLTKEQIKLQYPEQCAAIATEAAATAVTEERDRVDAHLTMGEASGDMKTALTAVREGTKMTVTMQSKYMAAGMRRKDREDRQEDSDSAGAVVDGTSKKPTETAVVDNGDLVAKAMGLAAAFKPTPALPAAH